MMVNLPRLKQPVNVRIVRVPFIIPPRYDAQVLLPDTIFVRRGEPWTPPFLAHELRHVEQLRERGYASYLAQYVLGLLRYDRDEHPMEQSADRAMRDARYLQVARTIIEARGPLA